MQRKKKPKGKPVESEPGGPPEDVLEIVKVRIVSFCGRVTFAVHRPASLNFISLLFLLTFRWNL